MTNHTVNCDYFTDRLMAYLEHETDDATRAALERHALGCDECGALLADLRKLRSDTARLPELVPSRDLWSGIAARIEAPVVPIGTVRQVEQTRSRTIRRVTRVALIAASLVGAAGLGYVVANARSGAGTNPVIAQRPAPAVPAARDSAVAVAPEREVAANPPATTPERPATAAASSPRPLTAQLAVATLTRDYDREIARLRMLLEQRRNQLDPVTVAVIERNMAVIDTAIVQCKRAIARDPASRFLIESLNQSLQTKVELMRTAALLPSRT